MGDFKREQRYIVLKLKDIHQLPNSEQNELLNWLERLESLLPDRQYVCVESDWPECEIVWAMIKDRIEGKPSELDTLRARVTELESALTKSALREAALMEKMNDAYEEGWHACACWAGRDDLHCDTDSKAYTDERDERLAKIKEAS